MRPLPASLAIIVAFAASLCLRAGAEDNVVALTPAALQKTAAQFDSPRTTVRSAAISELVMRAPLPQLIDYEDKTNSASIRGGLQEAEARIGLAMYLRRGDSDWIYWYAVWVASHLDQSSRFALLLRAGVSPAAFAKAEARLFAAGDAVWSYCDRDAPPSKAEDAAIASSGDAALPHLLAILAGSPWIANYNFPDDRAVLRRVNAIRALRMVKSSASIPWILAQMIGPSAILEGDSRLFLAEVSPGDVKWDSITPDVTALSAWWARQTPGVHLSGALFLLSASDSEEDFLARTAETDAEKELPAYLAGVRWLQTLGALILGKQVGSSPTDLNSAFRAVDQLRREARNSVLADLRK